MHTASITDRIAAYEAGELNHTETVELFQELVSSSMIDHLQGSYSRTAYAMVQAGLIAPF